MTAPTDRPPITHERAPTRIPGRQARRQALTIAFGVLVVLALGIGAYVLFGMGEESAPTTTVPAFAAGETVVVPEGANYWLQVELDADRLPHFVTINEDQTSLIVGRCLDPTCARVETGEVLLGMGGEFSGLTLDADGNPLIPAVVWDTEEPVGALLCDDPLCASARFVGAGDGPAPVLGIDADGRPMIAFDSEAGLRLGRCADEGCTEFVTSAMPDHQMPLIVTTDSSGLPVIVAHEPGVVATHTCLDAGCASFSTDLRSLPEELAMASFLGADVNAEGEMALGLIHGRLGAITCEPPLCAEVSGVSWVEPAFDSNSFGVAMRSDGRPVFAYTRPGPEKWEVVVAACDDPSCVTGTMAVVEPDHGALAVDLALDNDLPVVAWVYQSETQASIYRCIDPACLEGAAAVTRWDQASQPTRESVAPLADLEVLASVGVRQSWFSAVAGHDDGIGAFGSQCDDDGCAPVVMWSVDGGTWTSVVPEIPFEGGETSIWRAVTTEDGTVLGFGDHCSGPSPEEGECVSVLFDLTDPAIWRSVGPDGLTVINAMVPVSDGVFLFGGIAERSAAWFSDDLASWTEVTVSGMDDPYTWVLSAVPVRDGYLATGTTCVPEDEWSCYRMFWRSDDGSDWQLLVEPDGLDELAEEWNLFEVADGVMLHGFRCPAEGESEEGECGPGFWFSADAGRTWESIDAAGLGFVDRVFPHPDGFVTTGFHWDDVFASESVILGVSSDLMTWEFFEAPAGDVRGVNGMVVDGDRLLLAGIGDEGATIWSWQLP